MKNKNILNSILVTGLASITSLILLSGCSVIDQFKSLPAEQRYHYINEVKDSINYKTTGEVITSRYDRGDGVFSPSFFRAEIQGENTFELLTDRVKSLPEAECQTLVEEQSNCSVWRIDVAITRDETNPNKIILEITDVLSGRTSK